MSSLPGRYFSKRDLNIINSFNAELLGEIVQSTVIIFKLAPSETKTNIYGESAPKEGKFFYSGVEVTCWIEHPDLSGDHTEFGVDVLQNVKFRFREKTLQLVNCYIQEGDCILYTPNRYYEVDFVNREQFIGGIPEKSFSLIADAHYTKLSKINLVNRQL